MPVTTLRTHLTRPKRTRRRRPRQQPPDLRRAGLIQTHRVPLPLAGPAAGGDGVKPLPADPRTRALVARQEQAGWLVNDLAARQDKILAVMMQGVEL